MNDPASSDSASIFDKKYRSLSRHLVQWFLLLALVPLLLVSWFSYQQANRDLSQAAQDELQQSALLSVRFIRDWFGQRIKEISNQADSRNNLHLLASLRQGLQDSAKSLEDYVRSADWRQLVDARENELMLMRQRYDYIYNLALIDTEGNILYSAARESDLGTNLLHGPYADTRLGQAFRQALASDQVVFSDVERYAPSSSILAGFVIAPMRDSDGRVMGVCVMQLSMHNIFGLLNTPTTADSTSLTHYVVAADGRLRTPVRSDSWNEVPQRRIDTEQVRVWLREHGKQGREPDDQHEFAFEYIGPEGRSVIGIHHLLKLANVKWALVSEVDSEEALASASWLGKVISGVAILTAGLVILIAVYQARRITRPIIRLADASMKVAAGATDHQVNVSADDEIGKLADAFNHMLQVRQRHEQALKLSTQQAQQALADLAEQKFALDQHAIVAITDLQGTITSVNDKFVAISGYSREELLGSNHRILKSGVHDGAFFRDMYRTIASGKVWHGEICNRAKDGHLYWVDSTIAAFLGDDGKPKSYIAIRTDISERKRAELALEDSSKQLELVIDSTAVGVWDWQVQTGEVSFNERWAEMIGYSLEDLAPVSIDTWTKYVHPDDLVESGRLLEQHWRGEAESYICEARMKHRDGRWVWVLDTGKVVEWLPDGKPKRMIGTHLDITERKQVELDMQRSEALLRGLFELSPVGIALNDYATGEFLMVNNALIEPTGYSHDEFVNLSYWDITPREYESQEARQLECLEKTGRYGPYEKEYIRKDGSRYPVMLNGMTVEDPASRKKMIWSIVVDTSERKQVELALIEAKNQAEMAARTKSQFLASMSHEIRTPMNGVLGMLGLLSKTRLDEEQQHRVMLAQSSAQSLLTLINDILDFSKVDAGKLELESLDFNINQMLGDFAESMAHQAQDKNLELVLDVTGVSQSMVKGDPGRLRQVLTNLVGNAIKFTDFGEVEIRVALQDYGENLWQLQCSVIDTGIGIPADKCTLLFDVFRQLDASTTRKYGGTGLGLVISRKLCELMGGTLGVSSEPGKGSCFEFSVLLEKSDQAQPVLPPVDVQGLEVLLVDDNALNRQVLNRQLTHWGVHVTEAFDAQQAMQLCNERVVRNQPLFDIALLDMQMPGTSGIDLASDMRADSRLKSIALVMMTQMGLRRDSELFTSLGVTVSFPKPATTMDLFRALMANRDDVLTLVESEQVARFSSDNSCNEKVADTALKNTSWPAGSRVLLVEDNRVNQLVAVGMLNNHGLQADVSADGREALDSLSSAPDDAPYTLVLMDCQMPEMDGYEATRQIRAGQAGEHNRNIPVIAMTANAMQGDQEKCLQAGMDDYIPKPVDPEVLLRKLRQWLVVAPVPASDDGGVEKNAQADAADANEIWNREELQKRLLGDEQLLNTLVDLFLDETPVRMQKLQQAVTQADYAEACQLAHSIKGVASNLAAWQLQQQAILVEQAARELHADQLGEALAALQDADVELQQCFRQYRTRTDEQI